MKQHRLLKLTLILLVLLGSFVFPVLSPAGLREAIPEIERGGDQTILLDELIIRGEAGGDQFQEKRSEEKPPNIQSVKRPSERPMLSTALSWKGKEVIELDIPKEILQQLTQPDLSYVLEREAAQDEGD